MFVGCVPVSSSLPSLSTNLRFLLLAEKFSTFFGVGPTSLVPRGFASTIVGDFVLVAADVRFGGGVMSLFAEAKGSSLDLPLRVVERVPTAMS